MEQLLWYILAGLALGSALGVIAIKKPLYSSLCLVLHLFMIASLFAFLNAHFLATAQIIVYAGAIMVLIIFVIMLLSLEGAEKKSSIIMGALSVLAGIGLLTILVPSLKATFPGVGGELDGGVRPIGKLLFTEYLYSFEIASVLIMVAIVGAVVLARRIKKDVAS